MSRIYISAAHKSSGKTTLSIGLCAALHQKGFVVQPFKKGPDYIDPLWLSRASERACHNLDFNTMSDDEILRTMGRYAQGADVSIIEGNKGLYDGVALDGSDSNAAVAKLTQSPIILVIDTRGVTRGVAPLLKGYQDFDNEINIAGVIYNLSNGGRHEDKLRAVTEEYTDIPVLGVVKKNTLLEIDERHLGLMPSNESEEVEQKINDIANIVAESVDLDALMAIAESAPILDIDEVIRFDSLNIKHELSDKQEEKLRIGICEDQAFGFYYEGDKQALRDAGAELISINTLEDEKLPDNLDGLFIGGGFPETQMQALANNTAMRYHLKKAIEAGLPTYAECGGLMYLSQSLHWNGQSAPMVGIIPADAKMYAKPQGRGYVELEETSDMLWKDNSDLDGSETNRVKAHEFHYSRLESMDKEILSKKGKFAYKVHRGVGITGEYDGWVYKNLLATYAHMRDTDNFHWSRRFVDFIRQNKSIASKVK